MLPTKNQNQEKISKSKSSKSLRKKSRKHLQTQKRNIDIESIYMNTIGIGPKKEQHIDHENRKIKDKKSSQLNKKPKRVNDSNSTPSTRYQNFIQGQLNPEIQKTYNNQQNSLHHFNKGQSSCTIIKQKTHFQIQKQKQQQKQKRKKDIKKQEASPQQSKFICQICYRSMTKLLQVRLFHCLHAFCGQCIKTYVLRKLKAFQEIICPQQSCNNLLDDKCSFFRHIPAEIKQRYIKNKQRYAILKDPSLKLCPTPNCQGILKLNDLNFVICDICKKRMCKFCLLIQHQGQCEKNQVDYLQNVFQYRQCSKCKIVVQKIKDCNHIKCKCKHQFCYRCGITWVNRHNCLQKTNNQQVHRPVIVRNQNNNVQIPRVNQQSRYSCLSKFLVYILIWLIIIPILEWQFLLVYHSFSLQHSKLVYYWVPVSNFTKYGIELLFMIKFCGLYCFPYQQQQG